MVHGLEVWLFADRVGTLALVDGRLNFCYTPDWLSRKDAVALSASLPLKAETFDDRKTRPFFAGLLPKGRCTASLRSSSRFLARRRILELARLLPATACKLQSAPERGFAGNAVVEQIKALIEQRCALTIRRLGNPAAENDAAAEPSV